MWFHELSFFVINFMFPMLLTLKQPDKRLFWLKYWWLFAVLYGCMLVAPTIEIVLR